VEIANAYSLDQWRDVRLLAARHALEFSYSSLPLKEMLAQMLSIAEKGLRQRGFGEEVYLEPLYQRLATNRCPADDVRLQFLDGGVEKMIASNDMRNLFFGSLLMECTQ
jgi:gamma-glutamylcysteine synthetase